MLFSSTKIYLNFLKNLKNVDLVAGRLLFFEVINTFHPLDYKFCKTKVVNLTKEYNCIHLSGESTFFRNSLIKGEKIYGKCIHRRSYYIY